MSRARDRLRATAAEHFGWTELRPEQLQAMEALTDGRDALVVLPTGAGKSAVYQVPAVLLPGPTVVVSPLLALQHDQVQGLAGRDDREVDAVRLTSGQRAAERDEAFDRLGQGDAEFVYLAPEQLRDPARVERLAALGPSLVAVDEAHCVSMWGHDFRPDYLRLGEFVDAVGRPPVVAVTATASPPVRRDIVEHLGLRDPVVVTTGMDRPNLFLEARLCTDEDQRRARLREAVTGLDGSGIVYTATRRGTGELADDLRAAGVDTRAYHGGMRRGERDEVQRAFADGELRVVVATSAFGMGIDVGTIRWILHAALPDSPDTYVHEIGRAGRDGRPATALLLHRAEDTGIRRYFTTGPPREEEVGAVVRALGEAGTLGRSALRERTGLGPRKLARIVALLQQIHAVTTAPGDTVAHGPRVLGPDEAAAAARAEAERQRTVERSRIEMMLRYAQAGGCRTSLLLGYFGEDLGPCGHCDNCAAGRADDDATDRPHPVGSAVRHSEWGRGQVMDYEGDQLVVLFDDVGYKTLSVPLVTENDLLEPLP
ncbi:MAG TPA: RecQ family ATP-dependent DNA helicase [Streptosporangiales bacterium]